MKRVTPTTRWLITLIIAVHPGVAQQPAGVIRGSVVEVDRSLPLPGALIELFGANESSGGIQTTTNERGDFAWVRQIFIDEKPAYYDFANKTHNMTGAEVFAQFAPGGDEAKG